VAAGAPLELPAVPLAEEPPAEAVLAEELLADEAAAEELIACVEVVIVEFVDGVLAGVVWLLEVVAGGVVLEATLPPETLPEVDATA
jgi:hypothetical protein